MKANFIFIVVIAIVFLFACSCTKSQKPGNAMVTCNVTNGVNNHKLSNITIYLKKQSNNSPPSSLYGGLSYSQQAASNSNSVIFTGVYQGLYSVSVSAYDTANNKIVPMSGNGYFAVSSVNSTVSFSVSY